MKKSLSLLLVLTLLVSLVAGLGAPALAEEGVGAVSEATVLTVCLQAEGDVAVPIKTYNISELTALAEVNEAGAAYVYYKKDALPSVGYAGSIGTLHDWGEAEARWALDAGLFDGAKAPMADPGTEAPRSLLATALYNYANQVQ